MSTGIKSEIDRIRESWTALDELLRSFSEEQLATLQKDRWSIQDHLAHIAVAEQFFTAVLTGQPPHEPMGIDPETLMHSSDDEINEIGYQRTKSFSPSQVVDLRQRAHQQLLNTIVRLSDDDLLKPYAPYGEPTDMTLLDILRGNTYEHYDLHRGWIEAIAREGESAGA